MEKNDFDNMDLTNSYEDEIDVSQTKLANKSMELQQLIVHFEYRLKGYMWKANGEKYYYVGEPLVGESTIKDIMSLLNPFSSEVLHISNKPDFNWQKQLLRTRLSFLKIVTPAIDIDAKKQDQVWRAFTNIMLNIGDIITNKNSQEFLKSYFGMEKERMGYENYREKPDKEVVI